MTWSVHPLGSVDLIDPGHDGVMLLRDGVRGLNMPPVTRHTSKSPAVAGSRHRGWVTDERSVFWPTLVWSQDGTDDWHGHDSLLWSLLRPDMTGEWEVVTDRGGARTLTCRWVGDSDHQFGRDPLKHGWAIYGIELVAEDPYWSGEPVTRTWGTADSGARTFLPGPPFWIGSSATVDTATLTNPGELPAHMVWTIEGPCQSAQVGFRHEDMWGRVTRSMVEVPFPVADGEHLVIDTRPAAQTAVLHSGVDVTDRTGDLGDDVAFAPIPAGDDAVLELLIDGAGSITADLTPLYWRAF